MEGTVLSGKYRLESMLGRGGMGSVWKAFHLGLQAHVAVKLMDPLIARDPMSLARFNREARAAAALRSPHVVQVLDYGIDEASQTPFIVMEMLEGESLGSRLTRVGRLSPVDTARLMTDVCRALHRAHESGVVHRDLKPDNIFLVWNDDQEIAKVLDFGVAKARAYGADSQTHTGAVIGTPYYMSPEQISGTKDVDFRTDIWALGVIAFECMSGDRPFRAETIGGLAIMICTQAIPAASSLGATPPALDAWFAKALARAPQDRFQSVREFADGLRRACGIEGQPVPNANASAAYPAQPGAPMATGGSPVSRTGTAVSNGMGPQVSSQTANAMAHTPPITTVTKKSSSAGIFAALAGALLVLGGVAWFLLRGGSEPAAMGAPGGASAAAPSAPAAVASVAAPVAPPTPTPAPTLAETSAPQVAPAPAALPAPSVSAKPSVAAVVAAPRVPKASSKPAVARPAEQPAPAPAAAKSAAPSKPSLESVITQRR